MVAHGKRRALGQHFLKDQALCLAIAQKALKEAQESGCTSLLEIGPGKGAITREILNELKHYPGLQRFLLVEKDQKLGQSWSQSLTEQAQTHFSSTQLSVRVSDFLCLPQSEWLQNPPLAVVSNLPYSSGTAIFTRLAAHPEAIATLVLMFQAEVAQRLRAEPNTKAQGSLSVWTQNRWTVEKLWSVPPGAFSPPPLVQSEVVVLRRRTTPRIPFTTAPEDQKVWQSFLKVCFSQKRKMLRSLLPWKRALERSQVKETLRAEALSWEDWEKLYLAVRDELNLSTDHHPSTRRDP
ncbi:MAG: 16S rRNA (adenine(1518)-N(6)/adenine(1519)-N(6))-dimethyltransferase RsmA [Bdellovibrionia bacterium]